MNGLTQIPVDADALGIRTIIGVHPLVDNSGAQRHDTDGDLLWCLMVIVDRPHHLAGVDMLIIEYASPEEPPSGLAGAAPDDVGLTITGLTALPWALPTNSNGDRRAAAGVCFRADHITYNTNT